MANITERIAELEAQLASLKTQVHVAALPASKIINNLEWLAGSAGRMSYYDALTFAKRVGNGWRLPTVAELVSLYDYNKKTSPHFSETGAFWAAERHIHYGWYVTFSDGRICGNNKADAREVRLVRTVPKLQAPLF